MHLSNFQFLKLFSISRKIHLNHKKKMPPLQEYINLPCNPNRDFEGWGQVVPFFPTKN